MQKNIYRQAALAGLTVVLTIVILFAMTSAWYTNIVQTSGLAFEAEAWGFDGTITVDNSNIKAAPGDDGIVHLEVENSSSSISAISVNVSKTGMLEEMQKRLFFYVDTHMSRDGETMNRVYLNSKEGYTYTLFSNGTLTLTEQVSNAPQIKWEWVYDVLGYYVLGQTQTITTDAGTTEKMIIQEYLRPITYDYDAATTTLTTNGDTSMVTITTVDGITSPEVYLEQLSKTDGYKGEIDRQDKTPSGYYPVDVDSSGYGVYAYLCNYTEIELATKYDTMLGELAYRDAKGEDLEPEEATLLTHKVTLTISAQKNESTAVNVTNLSALQNAITNSTADVIQLSSDITIPSGTSLTIPANSRVMVDLNNHTITSAADTAIKANPGSSLTMINGNLTGPGIKDSSKTYGIYTTGAEVVMSGVAMNNFQYGIYMGDNEKYNDQYNEQDSRVHMVDCNIDAEWYAVFISGNGSLSEQKTQLIIEKSTLSSDGIVITGNGDASGNGRWGTDIQILSSIITQTSEKEGAGIYQPQKNSTLTIQNSTVSGYTGMAIKGGSVRIIDSTIEGFGGYKEPEPSGSGFSDTGDAVYIETGYDYDIQLEISGDKTKLTHKATNSRSLRVFEADATCVSVKIYAGTFDEQQPAGYIDAGSEQKASGGKYVVSVTSVKTETTEATTEAATEAVTTE